jgi:hypothetical protein
MAGVKASHFLSKDKMKHKGKRKRIYRKKNEVAENAAFPGYPHYPQSEDVMMTSAVKRTELDVEKLPERVPVDKTVTAQPETSEPTATTPSKESDLNRDDLVALGPKDADMDGGDDEIMSLSGDRYDRTDEDLDIPGTELDDENEKIGNEDEENNYYSLGGDKEENSS